MASELDGQYRAPQGELYPRWSRIAAASGRYMCKARGYLLANTERCGPIVLTGADPARFGHPGAGGRTTWADGTHGVGVTA